MHATAVPCTPTLGLINEGLCLAIYESTAETVVSLDSAGQAGVSVSSAGQAWPT